jgi:hypothetical protein
MDPHHIVLTGAGARLTHRWSDGLDHAVREFGETMAGATGAPPPAPDQWGQAPRRGWPQLRSSGRRPSAGREP